ncbi:MAG: N-acetyl-gamma-glutamyl-phosphate reductase, partial [Verrucomicrobiota bacterium]
ALGIRGRFANLIFEDLSPNDVASRADIVFLALPHGVSSEFASPLLEQGKTVIDLSADFRIKDEHVYLEFYGVKHKAPELLKESVYALPELHRDEFKNRKLFACPGCYPTSILLALAPAFKSDLIDCDGIVINSLSGVSGAGKKSDLVYSFCERDSNVMPYSWPKHRHLSEIEQELVRLSGDPTTVSFTPHLLPIVRGMLSSISAKLKEGVDLGNVRDAFETSYKDEHFVSVLVDGDSPEIRHVVKTNSCQLAFALDQRTNRLQIVSVIDNLVKGASGQAVQVMNHILQLPEEEGLIC